MPGEAIKVAVRVRPFSQREISMGAQRAISVSGPTTTVHIPQLRTFTYDASYWSHDPNSPNYASQEVVVAGVGSVLLSNALEGFNGCVFAYGQTGSGKSYSVFGYRDAPGFIPWTVDRIFAEKRRMEADPLKELRVWVSYLEIYNEHLHDLLHVQMGHGQDKDNLKLMDHPKLGVYVSGLNEEPGVSHERVEKLLEFGAKKRVVAATQMNAHSSRSHAVLTLRLCILAGPRPKQGQKDKRHEVHARINLIDLAGSERQSRAQSEGQELREACAINKSLSALGLVIKELSETQPTRINSVKNLSKGATDAPERAQSQQRLAKDLKIPFRASKLTFLLKDSLAGNSKTQMVACISPAADCVEETLSTLRFAASVKKIKTVATQNFHTKEGLIASLRSELESLRAQMSEARNESREEVQEQERLIKEMMKGYEDQLEQANRTNKMREEALSDQALTQDEINSVFGMGKNTPYLLNMSDDPTLAGCLLYYLVPGKQRCIGAAKDNAICLTGIGIPDKLCVIENNGNTSLSICKCSNDGRVVVGGKPLEAGKPVQLKHGQRIFLGRAFAMKVAIPGAAGDGMPEAEDTDLLLETLDDESAAIEHSQAWCSLRDYLRYWVQQMPVDQARALTEEVKQAAKACDEANEITAECRKGEGLFFEVDLTSALRMSVVVRVLRSRPGFQPSEANSEDPWLQLYIWSVSQMLERLDRMRDCYHSFVKTGRLGVDALQDPWHEAWSATIWHRLTDIEKERSGLAIENRRLQSKEASLMARGVMNWTAVRGERLLKLCFVSWTQVVDDDKSQKPLMQSARGSKDGSKTRRRISSGNSGTGQAVPRRAKAAVLDTPSPRKEAQGQTTPQTEPAPAFSNALSLPANFPAETATSTVSSAGSSLAISASRTGVPTQRTLGGLNATVSPRTGMRDVAAPPPSTNKKATDAGTGATSSSSTSSPPLGLPDLLSSQGATREPLSGDFITSGSSLNATATTMSLSGNVGSSARQTVTDLEAAGRQLDAVVEAALAAATAAVGSAPLEVPGVPATTNRSVASQFGSRGTVAPGVVAYTSDNSRATKADVLVQNDGAAMPRNDLRRNPSPARSPSPAKVLEEGTLQEQRWPVREAFESLRAELVAHRLEASRLNEDRTQLHEVLGRFERLLERLAPPDGRPTAVAAPPLGPATSPGTPPTTVNTVPLSSAQLVSSAYGGQNFPGSSAAPDVTRLVSSGSPPMPPPGAPAPVFRQMSQVSQASAVASAPAARCVMRVNPPARQTSAASTTSQFPPSTIVPPPSVSTGVPAASRSRSRSPTASVPVAVTPAPVAIVGVDENHDGRPEFYLRGADWDCDGIPDAIVKTQLNLLVDRTPSPRPIDQAVPKATSPPPRTVSRQASLALAVKVAPPNATVARGSSPPSPRSPEMPLSAVAMHRQVSRTIGSPRYAGTAPGSGITVPAPGLPMSGSGAVMAPQAQTFSPGISPRLLPRETAQAQALSPRLMESRPPQRLAAPRGQLQSSAPSLGPPLNMPGWAALSPRGGSLNQLPAASTMASNMGPTLSQVEDMPFGTRCEAMQRATHKAFAAGNCSLQL